MRNLHYIGGDPLRVRPRACGTTPIGFCKRSTLRDYATLPSLNDANRNLILTWPPKFQVSDREVRRVDRSQLFCTEKWERT